MTRRERNKFKMAKILLAVQGGRGPPAENSERSFSPAIIKKYIKYLISIRG